MVRVNKRGTVDAMFILFWLIVVGIVWIVGLSGMVNDIGEQVVVENAYTGLEAFFYGNLNYFILVFWLISVFAVTRYGFG